VENKEESVDPWVRACQELFELMCQICKTQEDAEKLWKDAFWFAFDGVTPPVIPDYEVAKFIGWVERHSPDEDAD
jgi:hypothetical protein